MRTHTLSLLLFLFLTAIHTTSARSNEDAPLTLQKTLATVYESNPGLMAARAELEETEELYPQARSGWFPRLDAQTGIYRTKIDNSNFGTADGTTTKDVSVNLNQPLWRGGRTSARVSRAKELINAGHATLRNAEQKLFLQTIVAYVNVLRDRELLSLRSKNELNLNQEYIAAQERAEIGDITQTDVSQAKTRFTRAQSERIAASGNRDISEAEFEEMTGFSASEKMTRPSMHIEIPKTLEEMFTLAENSHPDILMAKFQQSAAEYNVDAIFAELLPQVSAYATYNKQYDPQPGLVDDAQEQTVGLRATLALYEGGEIRSRVREAESAAKREQFEIDEIRRKLKQEVTSNWKAWQASIAETRSRRVEIDSALLALEGVREEAKMGERTVLDILDADQELLNAKASLARARRDEAVAQFSLAASLGLLGPENFSLQIYDKPLIKQ